MKKVRALSTQDPSKGLPVSGAAKKAERIPGALRHLVVPIDFSRASLKALRYAAAFADRFRARVNKNTYNYCVLIVENSDQDLQITFYLTDDREMNWLNEFFDSRFFTREETQDLFRLLYRKKHAQAEPVGRFRVDLSHWEPRHAEIIVLSFTPRASGDNHVTSRG
jgi:nucleotide-binding universal stress UspA family protein